MTKLEELAFDITDMHVFGKPNLTTRGHIVATFTMRTARFSICNVRLMIDWNEQYDVSFNLEGQVSFLTIHYDGDREELIRVAARAYDDKKRRIAYGKHRIVSMHAVKTARIGDNGGPPLDRE